MQGFESVVYHLELAFLSRKFRIIEHAQSSFFQFFSFFSAEFTRSYQDLHFHQILGVMPQKPVVY